MPNGRPRDRPTGRPTRIRKEDWDVIRSLKRENDTPIHLADAAYRVRQNPPRPDVAAARRRDREPDHEPNRPDYLIEDRVFDCYSPGPKKPVRGIHSEVRGKVVDEQCRRVVTSRHDWQGDLDELRASSPRGRSRA